MKLSSAIRSLSQLFSPAESGRFAAVLAALLLGSVALAQPEAQEAPPLPAAPAAQPDAAPVAPDGAAPAPVEVTASTITITAVTGLVQVRDDEAQPWRPAQAGQEMPIGGEFRTGPRSAVRFSIGPDQVVTLERLGVVKVLEAIRGSDGRARTDVGMKYGRSVMQVEAGGLEHESTIRTPSAVLAIRGSLGFLQEYRNSLLAGADSGDVSWTNTNLKGRQIKLPPGSHQTGDTTSTAQTNANTGTFNPLGDSATTEEVALLSDNASGFYAATEQAGLDQISGQQGAPVVVDMGQFPLPNLTDGLAFAIQWVALSGTDLPDLDFFVVDPLGRTIGSFIGSDMVSEPDAFALGDNTGQGDVEGQATEGVVFPDGFPSGTYNVGVDHFSGVAASYQIDILLEGQPKINSINDTIQPGGLHERFFNIDQAGNVTPTGGG